MESNKGITLITLAITIIVIILLAGTAIYSGVDTIQNTRKTTFIAELEIIQSKVNNIYEERKLGQQQVEYYNGIGKDITNVDADKVSTALGNISSDGFKYFDKAELKKIDIEVDQEVLVNYDTRTVVSLKGLSIDGKQYYKLSDIPGYKVNNVAYTNKNTTAPTFETYVDRLNGKWKIGIKNIQYNGNVQGGSLSYKLHDDTNWISNDNTTTFEVTEVRNI